MGNMYGNVRKIMRINIIISVLIFQSFILTNNCSENIGLVIDLDNSTTYKHPDFYDNIDIEGSTITDYFNCDCNMDGIKDIVLFLAWYNGSTENPIKKSVWILPGPFILNDSLDNKIIKWDLPDAKKMTGLIDIGNEGKPDLIIYSTDKGKNNSISIRTWNINDPFPWKVETANVSIANDNNGTLLFVQTIDANNDGYEELMAFKEYTFSDQSYHSRIDVLVANGRNDFRGFLNESIFDTVIHGDWNKNNYTFPFLTYYDGKQESILINNPSYRPQGYLDPIGRVYTISNIDLSKRTFIIEGNISREIIDLRKIGYMVRAQPIRHNNMDDLLFKVYNPWQGNLIFSGSEFKKEVIAPELDDCLLYTDSWDTSIGDFDGDGSDDLISNYVDGERTYITVGFDIDDYQGQIKMVDAQDITIRDSNLSREMTDFFIDDVDRDGKEDVIILCSGSYYQLSWRLSMFIVKGRGFSNPVIEDIKALDENVLRGGSLRIEVFGKDPQNFPKYMDYNLSIKIANGSWFIPEIQKIEDNWTSDEPYEGSRIIWITVPKGNISGMIDLKIQAVNTFGLYSPWVEREDIACIINDRPRLYKIEYYPPILERDEKLNLHGFILDKDDDGPFHLKAELVGDLDPTMIYDNDNQSKGEFEIQCAITDSVEAGRSYLVNVSVTDPIGDTASVEEYQVFLVPDRPFFELIRTSIGVFRGMDIGIEYDLFSDMDTSELRVWSMDVLDQNMTLVQGSNKKVNITVPLDADLGSKIFSYSLYDGYWYSNGSFETTIQNNPPSIDLPNSIKINGKHSFDLSQYFNDIEDGKSLIPRFKEKFDGLDVEFNRTTGQMTLDPSSVGNWSLAIEVEDKDGDTAKDTMRVIMEKENVYDLEISVSGLDGGVIVGASVRLSKEGSIIDTEISDTSGKVLFSMLPSGSYTLGVSPSEGYDFVEGSRSGYLPKEIEVTIPSQPIVVVLEWKDVVRTTQVMINVVDQEGHPVPNASIELVGGKTYGQRTDQDGSALFADILPGDYEISIHVGDENVLRTNVRVDYGDHKVLNYTINLEVDGVGGSEEEHWPLIVGVVFVIVMITGSFLLLALTKRKKRIQDVTEE